MTYLDPSLEADVHNYLLRIFRPTHFKGFDKLYQGSQEKLLCILSEEHLFYLFLDRTKSKCGYWEARR